MSRLPFWTPPNAPNPIKRIPKLIIKGSEGPLELRQQAIADRIGDVKQFYLKAAHNHAAGIIDESSLRRETDQFKMAYTMLPGGQEIIEIEVKAGVILGEEEEAFLPWDWLLIDMSSTIFSYDYIEYEYTGYTYSVFGARLKSPRADNPDEDPLDPPVHGKAFDFADWGEEQRSAEDPPLLQFAGSDIYPLIGDYVEHADYPQISSLLVDIRLFKNMRMIEVQLYGRVNSMIDDTIKVGEKILGKAWIAHQERRLGLSSGGSPIYTILTYNQAYGDDTEDGLKRILEWYPEAASQWYITDNSSHMFDQFMPHTPPGGVFGTAVEDKMLDISGFTPPGSNNAILYGNEWVNSESRWEIHFPGAPAPSDWSPPSAIWDFHIGGIWAETTPCPFGPYGNGTIHHALIEWSGGTSVIPTPPPVPTQRFWDTWVYDQKFFFLPVYQELWEDIPVEPKSEVTVSALAFRGDPKWGWSEHYTTSDYIYYLQWEIEDMYPERPPLIPLKGTAEIDAIPVEANADMQKMKLLGSIMFDQVTGGFTFTPA